LQLWYNFWSQEIENESITVLVKKNDGTKTSAEIQKVISSYVTVHETKVLWIS